MEPHSPLFLGVDGGQSSTLAVICDEEGRLLGSGNGGPSNHIHEPGGMERLRSALRDSVLGAWEQAGFSQTVPPRFASAGLGMTGSGEYAAETLDQIAACEHKTVVHDSISAHAGALAGAPGVIVIAGTGSVALGVDAGGKALRVGGWSHLMGDEGSGYDIGRQALSAAARMEDGRAPVSRLHAAVLAHFHAQTLWEVHAQIHAPGASRAEIAALARVTAGCAQEGDETARVIFQQAGYQLAELALAALRGLRMEGVPTPVAPVGGVFQAGELILAPLRRFLQAGAPLARVVSPLLPPAFGAVILAYAAAGLPLTAGKRENLVRAAGG